MTNIKALFEELEAAEAKTDMIDSMFDTDPENETLDEIWDKAYKEEHEIFEKLVNAIVEYTNNQIDKKTARKMIISKREEMKALFNMVA